MTLLFCLFLLNLQEKEQQEKREGTRGLRGGARLRDRGRRPRAGSQGPPARGGLVPTAPRPGAGGCSGDAPVVWARCLQPRRRSVSSGTSTAASCSWQGLALSWLHLPQTLTFTALSKKEGSVPFASAFSFSSSNFYFCR